MVFASQLFADKEAERAFRHQVEGLLREGKAVDALSEIDAKLGEIGERPFAKLGLSIQPESVVVTGWEAIGGTIDSLDIHGQPISAIGVDLANPDAYGTEPGGDMRLTPVLETSFYCDDVFPFGVSDRDGLCTGYGRNGATWRGSHEHRDNCLKVSGLDELYGAYHAVRPHMDRGELTELADYDAPRLTAMRCAVLVHMAIARAVEDQNLPRPMAVICGSNEDYPYFDAPVTTRADCEEANDAQAEAGDTDEALFTSLATLAPVRPNATYQFQVETEHVSGRSLRHRFVREFAEDAESMDGVIAAEEQAKPSLLDRLLRR
ncbi:hypothetical protein [Croceicoccus naphthovorans]|uniref:Uncharacterized protein n=1 Tax=Croceicoccus naphthovorans TaxID=1348774 RepID=A0A0G3XIF2_9SPHN|nr:hypothetical protein [Croceicoccus naphthovorans]AKM10389.1 hypothetical protein AB433_11150 [Croceicoccus naphthovorans]MBB3990086.1 hypothetical protein [Croceicoccus naphthovorans]